MLGALMDPNALKPAPDPEPAPAREEYRTVAGGGFDFMAGSPDATLPTSAGPAPGVPAASSTIGLSASPMSTPGLRIPDEVAPAVSAPATIAAAAPVSAPVAPRAREAMRTMIGVGLNPVAATPPSQPPPAPMQPMAPMQPVAPMPPVAPMSTLVAPVSPPAELPLGADTFVDPPRSASSARANRTMLGMSMPLNSAPSAAAASIATAPAAPMASAPVAMAPSPPAASPDPAPAAAAAAKRNIGPSNRTMLGVIAPVVARVSTPAAAPDPVPVAPPGPMYTPRNQPDTSASDVSIAGLPSPRRRLRGWLFALLGVGVLLVGCVIAAGLYYRMTRMRVDVAAAVAASATGETLGVDVLRAPAGTRARFGTIEQPLAGTHVDFPLAADALHVGDNAVAIDVLLPDGTVETHTVTLTVEYRVRADLATLTATPPAITVVVDALPGSTIVLDAQPLPLDAAGHGVRAYPIATLTPDASGTLSLTAHYTITPPAPAAAATGTLSSRVPTTVLHVERPADTATTDQPSIVVGGITQAGATVTIEGVAATVSADGHFSATLPLAAVGVHELHVAATLAGRAPASALIHVERVADLGRAAAAFPVDRTLTYARLAAAPASFVGQHVAIEGRVYNVDLQDGHGVLQMLARECVGAPRCPLWVTHPAIRDIALESWVRVVGTVAGEQQFVSQSGEVRTVPRIDAVFVLPSHP